MNEAKEIYLEAIERLYNNKGVLSETIEAIEMYVQELNNAKMEAIRHASKQYNLGYREGQKAKV
jgi:hypothetical protein